MLTMTGALLNLADAWAYPCQSDEDIAHAERMMVLALELAREAVQAPTDSDAAAELLTRILAAEPRSEALADAVDSIATVLKL